MMLSLKLLKFNIKFFLLGLLYKFLQMLFNPSATFNNSSGASPNLTPPPTTLGQRETADQDFVDCSCGLKVGCGMVVKVLDDNLCDILMVLISFASAQSRHCHLCSLEVNSL